MTIVTKYDYTKTPFNSDRFKTEVESSSIITALDRIDTNGTYVSVYFKDILSETDEDILGALIIAHTGIALVVSDNPTDTDKAPLFRSKVTATGWHYEPRTLSFKTSTYNSLYNKKPSGVDLGDAVLSFYEGNEGQTLMVKGVEESVETFQARIDSSCTKTVMTWEPHYDHELIGGIFLAKDLGDNDIYCWVLAAPGIPEAFGGSVPFFQGGFNLAFLAPSGRLNMNGRSSKFIAYDSVYHSGALGLVLKHLPGVKASIQMTYEQYKG